MDNEKSAWRRAAILLCVAVFGGIGIAYYINKSRRSPRVAEKVESEIRGVKWKSEKEENLLELHVQQAVYYQQFGEHVEAAKSFLMAAKEAQGQGDYEEYLDYLSLALQEFEDAGKYEEAFHILTSLPSGPIGSPENIEHQVQLAQMLIRMNDDRALDQLATIEELISKYPGSENLQATVHTFRGTFYTNRDDVSNAEKSFRAAITLDLAEHESEGYSELSPDALGSFIELQKLYISHKRPKDAQKIAEEVTKRTSGKYEDFSYYSHLLELANIFIEYDYTTLAENTWDSILSMYETAYKTIAEKEREDRSPSECSVFGMVTKALNEKEMMKFNLLKTGRYNDVTRDLDVDPFEHRVSSKFFDTTSFNIIVTPSPDTGLPCVQFIMELNVRNREMMKQRKVMGFRFRVDYKGDTILQRKYLYHSEDQLVVLLSDPIEKVNAGHHLLVIEVFLGDEQRYYHFQAFNIPTTVNPSETLGE